MEDQLLLIQVFWFFFSFFFVDVMDIVMDMVTAQYKATYRILKIACWYFFSFSACQTQIIHLDSFNKKCEKLHKSK